MIDRSEQIFQFLPVKYVSLAEDEYVLFWWSTHIKNVEEENYHIAFLSFHMLYMTAVYFLLFKVSKIHQLPYEHSLFHMTNDDETYYRSISSPFAFSEMNEKGVFRFLKLVGADYKLIGEVSRFINDRNNAAHAKGAIFYKNDPTGLEEKIIEYVKALEKIQNLLVAESKKVAQAWRVSKMSESDLKLYLENEIVSNSFTPAEIKAISISEKTKRPQVAEILDQLIEKFIY